MTNVSFSTSKILSNKVNITNVNTDQALEKYLLKWIVEDGWALQVNETEINWKFEL